MKRSILLTLLLAALALPINAEVYSGKYDNADWTIDTETGLLTITGNGTMPHFYPRNGVPSAPWYNFRNYVTSVSLSEGLGSISSYALADLKNLQKVSVPSSVRWIGEYAFRNCGLAEIDIPYVREIWTQAFAGCENLAIIRCGAGLKSIDRGAFADCDLTANNSVIYFASATPPTLEGTAEELVGEWNADYLDTRIILRVPTQAVSAYKQHAEWGKFLIRGGYADGLQELRAGQDYELAAGGILRFSEPTAFSLFTADGRTLFSGTADTFTLPAHGTYIIKIGSAAGKVLY